MYLQNHSYEHRQRLHCRRHLCFPRHNWQVDRAYGIGRIGMQRPLPSNFFNFYFDKLAKEHSRPFFLFSEKSYRTNLAPTLFVINRSSLHTVSDYEYRTPST